MVLPLITLFFSTGAFAQEKTGDMGLHDNGYLRVLKVKIHDLGSSPKETKTVQDVSGVPFEYIPKSSSSGDYIEVLVEIIEGLPEDRAHKVCIHYYDAEGEPMPGDSGHTDEGLSAGEIRSVVFDSTPFEAKSFKVWLPKVKK